ncbi:MAG: DUF4332 domain-containing protein [Promethearchaeota archaeon]
MDEEGFISFMKKKRKSQNTIKACVENAKVFDDYLRKHGQSDDTASAEVLESFIEEHVDKNRVSKYMWTLNYYFLFIENKELLKAANKIRQGKIKVVRKPFKLKKFRGVNAEDVKALASFDIHDTERMLESGKTPKMRSELAKKTMLGIEVIEEFVRLSDLARIQGLKGIRARLYHDAGFDTLEKLRKTTSEEVLHVTRKFVEQTGFDGIAPLPKEAQSAINTARKLPDIVEW